MRRAERRRRFRIRRKRRDRNDVDAGDAVEFGCCLIEVVGSAAILSALLVPAFLWMR